MFGDLKVECRAVGHRTDEMPVRFTIGGRAHAVVEVCDRWYDPEADYFKVWAEDGCLYLLRRTRRRGRWTLRYIRTAEPSTPVVPQLPTRGVRRPN